MTLCSDMAVCKDTASFFQHGTIGIANDATTSYSLAKIVGFRRAMEWMITNRTVHAQEALEWNVVNRVYDEANFERTSASSRANWLLGRLIFKGSQKRVSTWVGDNRSRKRRNSRSRT
jgi:2-(1,2-epoxy-1,2-dihydrophenyl)acetyl-CoA isomerase